jgi:general secretion pathway protein N
VTLKRYLLIAVATLLLALTLRAPAASLYAWLGKSDPPAPVQLHGLSGTLSDGHLSGLTLNGAPMLADLRWDLHPWWLLAARLDFHVDGGGEQGLLDGDLSLAPGGRVGLRNFKFSSGVKPLLAAAGFPLPWLDGRATMQFDALKLRNGVPRDAAGKALVHGVTWGMGQTTALGDFAADVARDGDAIVARLSSVSGPLDATGEVRLLDDSSYEIKIQFKPKPDASPAVQNLLRSTGTPDVQGYYHIEKRGKLT